MPGYSFQYINIPAGASLFGKGTAPSVIRFVVDRKEGHSSQIDLSNYAKGVYRLVLTFENGTAVLPVIKQ